MLRRFLIFTMVAMAMFIFAACGESDSGSGIQNNSNGSATDGATNNMTTDMRIIGEDMRNGVDDMMDGANMR